jgi:hypothetical protein
LLGAFPDVRVVSRIGPEEQSEENRARDDCFAKLHAIIGMKSINTAALTEEQEALIKERTNNFISRVENGDIRRMVQGNQGDPITMESAKAKVDAYAAFLRSPVGTLVDEALRSLS